MSSNEVDKFRKQVEKMPGFCEAEVLKFVTDYLANLVAARDRAEADAKTVKVTSVTEFGKFVVAALNGEDEDGTTAIHQLFDDAFDRAINDGADGVSIE